MDKFDFDAQAPIARNRIYVTWSETWSLARYIEEYLKSRRLRTDDAARAHIHHSIARYPWTGPLRKPDVDHYLDTSISKAELALPAELQSREAAR
jgi:hypothetical protein